MSTVDQSRRTITKLLFNFCKGWDVGGLCVSVHVVVLTHKTTFSRWPGLPSASLERDTLCPPSEAVPSSSSGSYAQSTELLVECVSLTAPNAPRHCRVPPLGLQTSLYKTIRNKQCDSTVTISQATSHLICGGCPLYCSKPPLEERGLHSHATAEGNRLPN